MHPAASQWLAGWLAEEKDAAIKEKADTQLGALPADSRLVYIDGGAGGNGANGQQGACEFGAVVTEKQADWTSVVRCTQRRLSKEWDTSACLINSATVTQRSVLHKPSMLWLLLAWPAHKALLDLGIVFTRADRSRQWGGGITGRRG